MGCTSDESHRSGCVPDVGVVRRLPGNSSPQKRKVARKRLSALESIREMDGEDCAGGLLQAGLGAGLLLAVPPFVERFWKILFMLIPKKPQPTMASDAHEPALARQRTALVNACQDGGPLRRVARMSALPVVGDA
eukprot:TRINITY_DN107134_c0_g1_i1.p1 TRINITY_DN107134_c0_g1~~TRINITY_DN107134_c0_g1_i1.p1  ORF type:complete len:135 (+),score=25.15 TRINITY_DN107134_c0_g1_i1:91-495(+)